ncbi:hypothetical protein [Streptomyces collinus]
MTAPDAAKMRRLLGPVCDTDRGENPLGWSELPPAAEAEEPEE